MPWLERVMGNALMDLGRVDLAITAFRKALEDQPLMTDLNYSLGRALQAGGQLPKRGIPMLDCPSRVRIERLR